MNDFEHHFNEHWALWTMNMNTLMNTDTLMNTEHFNEHWTL